MRPSSEGFIKCLIFVFNRQLKHETDNVVRWAMAARSDIILSKVIKRNWNLSKKFLNSSIRKASFGTLVLVQSDLWSKICSQMKKMRGNLNGKMRKRHNLFRHLFLTNFSKKGHGHEP